MRSEYALRRTWLSEAYLLARCTEGAIHLAGRAIEPSRAHKERDRKVCARRLAGEIAMHRAPPDAEEAEHHCRQALLLTAELDMRPLQAHCHHGLGTLHAKIGRREQARAELSTAIKLFRAMEMTFWLTRAENTLAQTT